MIKILTVSGDYKCASHLGERFIFLNLYSVIWYSQWTLEVGVPSLYAWGSRGLERQWQSWDPFLGQRQSKACVLKHYAKLDISCTVPRSGPRTQQVLINASAIVNILTSVHSFIPSVVKVQSLQFLLSCAFSPGVHDGRGYYYYQISKNVKKSSPYLFYIRK